MGASTARELKETLQVNSNSQKQEESKNQQDIEDLDEEITQPLVRYLKGSCEYDFFRWTKWNLKQSNFLKFF